MSMATKPRRTHSPITGKPYPKCKVPGCKDNVYSRRLCWKHQDKTS